MTQEFEGSKFIRIIISRIYSPLFIKFEITTNIFFLMFSKQDGKSAKL